MFIFCHFRLWHECRCLYVISLIIYDRESHATGQIKTKICSSLKPTLKPKIIKKSKVWQMFIFRHSRPWHECRCLYVISLIIYDRKSHATGQTTTNMFILVADLKTKNK